MKEKRKLILRPDGAYDVPLTKGLFAIVDAEDADLVGQYNWFAKTCGSRTYAAAKMSLPRGRAVMLHRFLLFGTQPCARIGDDIDHKDRNSLNNRRENLREATRSQNMTNCAARGAVPFIGVSQHPTSRKRRYRSAIRVNGRIVHLGLWSTPEEAARARDAAAREHYGEFATFNFPEEHV